MTDPTLGIDVGPLMSASDQAATTINHTTWVADDYSSTRSVIDEPVSRIARLDLIAEAKDVDWDDELQIRRLFVHTMMWGSGTTNGRGPRYTNQGLQNSDVAKVIREARTRLERGDIAGAYYLHDQLSGVDYPFFTKILWVLGRDVGVEPRPLILDSFVWKSLGPAPRGIGWDSVKVSGSRLRGNRYVANLRACEAWAGSSHSPEDVEYTLFMRSRYPTMYLAFVKSR